MQYTLGTPASPDMAAIERAISELDPSALLDFDVRASTVRISSVATQAELLDCLRLAGIDTQASQFARLPSECCGGCGQGETCCTGTCANLETDGQHCGICGNVCACAVTVVTV